MGEAWRMFCAVFPPDAEKSGYGMGIDTIASPFSSVLTHDAMSVTPNRLTTARTLLELFGYGEVGSRSGTPAVYATISARCPPAELPMTPMRSGSIPYLSALARRKRTAFL